MSFGSTYTKNHRVHPLTADPDSGGALGPGERHNAFYKDESENESNFPVIFKTQVPESSAGYTDHAFFATLGDTRNDPLMSDERNAEQEYLLQNMPKGALYEAAQIADEHGIGIAVRGTGLLAHMGIEHGNPTKAQEFKNKTSKEMDLWLSDEMGFGDVGAVMHYDPRVPGQRGPMHAPLSEEQVEAAWAAKLKHINEVRAKELEPLVSAERIQPPNMGKIKDWFKSRLNEFREEDHEYAPGGHYANQVALSGPFIHMKDRPNEHMYGDHDLFAFTNPETGAPVRDSLGSGPKAQYDLQHAQTFQAQHGGIWNWEPQQPFHREIKRKIMEGHSPPNGEPLVYVKPDGNVTAAFYVPAKDGNPANDRFESVWDHPEATQWLSTTHTGRHILEQRNPPRASPAVVPL